MELNDAQTIVDPAMAISGGFLSVPVGSRLPDHQQPGVHFLAEEFVAELLDQLLLRS